MTKPYFGWLHHEAMMGPAWGNVDWALLRMIITAQMLHRVSRIGQR